MITVLFQILLFFLPLFIFPFGNSQFEIPKVMLAMGVIDIAAVILLTKRQKISFSFSPTFLYLCGLLTLLTVYHLIFLSTSMTFFGNQFRMQGVLLLWQLILLGAISSQIIYRRMAYYWYVIVLAITFVGSFFFDNVSYRSVGTLGDPNALAGFAVVLWPFLFFAPDLPKIHKPYIRLVLLIITALIILLSGSRSGLIAFLVQITFYGLAKTVRNLKYATLGGLFLLAVGLALPFLVQTKYEDRSTIWQTAFTAGFIHPFFGEGFGNIQVLLRRIIEEEHNALIGYVVDSAHNIFLDWWVQGGIVGVILLLVLIISVFKRFYLQKNIFYLVLFLGLLSILSFNPVSVVILVFFWWLVGQGFCPDLLDRKILSEA